MTPSTALHGDLILPDRILPSATICFAERIQSIGTSASTMSIHAVRHDGYIAPGFIDLHVHGGAGADFMDGTVEAFATVAAAHAKHGTTSMVATSTVALPEQIIAMLTACRTAQSQTLDCRILGAHFYGPYFGANAAGCHPTAGLREPGADEFQRYLAFADVLRTATVAPELPGAEAFARACAARGIHVNLGHSHCTFDQAEAAIGWGARHVDHLFCAMSDRARLRQQQTYPMRGGLLEATLFFDELTTEVIADGKHLSRELLLLATKIKGPDRLALVTDSSRALDMPDGEYMFGPSIGGVPIVRTNGVGLMPGGAALASGVQGMDHMVRTLHSQTHCTIPEAIRMASLTPARVLGLEDNLGSLEPGKIADILLLDRDLRVTGAWLAGRRRTVFQEPPDGSAA